MPTQAQNPPPDKMVQGLQTPNPTDTFFREVVSRDSARWRENNPITRGTLYSSLRGVEKGVADDFPNLYFLQETVPIGSNTIAGMWQDEYVIWNWATVPAAQSPTNAEISLLADSITNPVYARVYAIKRDVYEANPYVATGTPFKGLLGAKITNGGIGYTEAIAKFFGPGKDSGVELKFVISDGVILEAVVVNEGTDLDATSTAQIQGDGSQAAIQLIVQPAAAILTSQKKEEFASDDPRQSEFVKVLKVWELLPGPWVPFTRYDDDLGPIQGRKRVVLNTGQLGGVIGPTAKTNYEARENSSVVSIQIEENWSDGSGSTGNPIYPVLHWKLYEQDRGAIQRRSQIVVKDPFDQEVGSFQRVFGSVVKTWFEPYQDNPYLLKKLVETWTEVTRDDRIKTSEFGGGVLRDTERTDEPDAQSVETGLLVVDSRLLKKSPHEQTLNTKKLIADAWPINHGLHTDEITGIVTMWTTQCIQQGTPYPGRSGYRGPFVEDKPYDRDKTIRIISSVLEDTLPGEEAWPIFDYPVHFPPQLLKIEAIWTDVVSKLTNAQAVSANVSVSSGSSGGVIITGSSGYHGLTTGRQVRNYFLGSPALQGFLSGLAPFKIIPSIGTVVLTQTHSGTTFAKGDDGGQQFSDNFQHQVHEVDIRDHLVNLATLKIIGATHTSPGTSAFAQSGGGSVASLVALGTVSTMTVKIPQSTPPVLISGQEILYDIKLRELPLGVWQVDRWYIKVP